MTRLSQPLLSIFLLSALSGCGASRAYESSAPAAAAPEQEPAPEEDGAAEDAAGAEAERVEQKAEQPPARTKISADEEMVLDSEESGVDTDEGAPAAAPEAPKEKKLNLVSELTKQLQALDHSLEPKTLSCEGAKPHQDAICSIAARICEMEEPSTTKSDDCRQAENSCKKAKKRYLEKCE